MADQQLYKFRKNMNKLQQKLKESSDAYNDSFPRSKPAVLVSTGAYNPVHLQHVKVFEVAKEHMEAAGYNVLAGFLSPSHDAYVRGKLWHASIASVHRIEMIKLATSHSSWMDVHKWEASQDSFRNFPDVAVEIKKQVEDESILEDKIEVFYLCGTDHFMRCGLHRGLGEIGVVAVAREGVHINLPKDNQNNVIVIQGDFASDISSSLVRRRMKAEEEGEVEESMADLLHPQVEEYLRKINKELGKSGKERGRKDKTFLKNIRSVLKL